MFKNNLLFIILLIVISCSSGEESTNNTTNEEPISNNNESNQSIECEQIYQELINENKQLKEERDRLLTAISIMLNMTIEDLTKEIDNVLSEEPEEESKEEKSEDTQEIEE